MLKLYSSACEMLKILTDLQHRDARLIGRAVRATEQAGMYLVPLDPGERKERGICRYHCFTDEFRDRQGNAFTCHNREGYVYCVDTASAVHVFRRLKNG